MNTSLIIAGNSPTCRSEIKGIIQSRNPDISILGVLSSGEELLKQILAQGPDVVICDADLPGCSCFEIMQRINIGERSNTRFIIFGGRDFDSVYKAFKFGAIDYLLLPVSPDSLQTALEKVSSLSTFTHFDSASRLFYVDDKGMDILRKKELPVDQVNQMYGTKFVDGLFRMVFVKYDALHSFERLNMNTQNMLDKSIEQIRRNFEDICADIICIRKSDGLMAVLNYHRDATSLVEVRIQELYKRIHRIACISRDITLTICVSTEITDPCNVWQIKEQVRDAEWSRMVVGTNKIIFWKKRSIANNHNALDRLNRIHNQVRVAIESLNTDSFRSAIIEFYTLPEDILLSREARMLFKQILYIGFEMYWDTIAKFADPTKTYDELAYCSHLCTTFTRHRDTLLSEYTKLMQRISEQVEKKYSSQISDAIYYIHSNIDKPLSLHLVSEAVQLSQGYLSHLFKKETGMNFSKFVTKQKNIYACELLCRTDLTIAEVAFRVGFPDTRAFSKHFKSVNNITPTRYRQLHGKSQEDCQENDKSQPSESQKSEHYIKGS